VLPHVLPFPFTWLFTIAHAAAFGLFPQGSSIDQKKAELDTRPRRLTQLQAEASHKHAKEFRELVEKV